MLHLPAILSLDSRNSSLFSWQLGVCMHRKSVRVEPLVELQITSFEYRFIRLTWGLDWVTDQLQFTSLQSSSAELPSIVFSSLNCTHMRNCKNNWSRTIFWAISSHAWVNSHRQLNTFLLLRKHPLCEGIITLPRCYQQLCYHVVPTNNAY